MPKVARADISFTLENKRTSEMPDSGFDSVDGSVKSAEEKD